MLMYVYYVHIFPTTSVKLSSFSVFLGIEGVWFDSVVSSSTEFYIFGIKSPSSLSLSLVRGVDQFHPFTRRRLAVVSGQCYLSLCSSQGIYTTNWSTPHIISSHPHNKSSLSKCLIKCEIFYSVAFLPCKGLGLEKT